MHYWKRPTEPAELASQRPAFTAQWKQDRAAQGKDAKFKWPKVTNDDGAEETLQERFYRITDNHCAYCDNTVQPASNVTMDHFKEKVGYEDEAYDWENLYACCSVCQARGKWHADVLRPDVDDYAFGRYFRYTHSGEIRVTCEEGSEDYRRAKKTIEVLKLDRPKLNRHREQIIGESSAPRRYPRPNTNDPAMAARIIERREKQDITRRPYREWFLTQYGAAVVCRCAGCSERNCV